MGPRAAQRHPSIVEEPLQARLCQASRQGRPEGRELGVGQACQPPRMPTRRVIWLVAVRLLLGCSLVWHKARCGTTDWLHHEAKPGAEHEWASC